MKNRHPVLKFALSLTASWIAAIVVWWGLLKLWANQCEGVTYWPEAMGLGKWVCGLTSFGLVLSLLAIFVAAGVVARMIVRELERHRRNRDFARRLWGIKE